MQGWWQLWRMPKKGVGWLYKESRQADEPCAQENGNDRKSKKTSLNRNGVIDDNIYYRGLKRAQAITIVAKWTQGCKRESRCLTNFRFLKVDNNSTRRYFNLKFLKISRTNFNFPTCTLAYHEWVVDKSTIIRDEFGLSCLTLRHPKFQPRGGASRDVYVLTVAIIEASIRPHNVHPHNGD